MGLPLPPETYIVAIFFPTYNILGRFNLIYVQVHVLLLFYHSVRFKINKNNLPLHQHEVSTLLDQFEHSEEKNLAIYLKKENV